jgi:hypothetical protein
MMLSITPELGGANCIALAQLALCIIYSAIVVAVSIRNARSQHGGSTFSGRIILKVAICSLILLLGLRQWPWSAVLQLVGFCLIALLWRRRMTVSDGLLVVRDMLPWNTIRYVEVLGAVVEFREDDNEVLVGPVTIRARNGALTLQGFDLSPAWLACAGGVLGLNPAVQRKVGQIERRQTIVHILTAILLVALNGGAALSALSS